MRFPPTPPVPAPSRPGPPGPGVPLSIWAAGPAGEAALAVTGLSRPGDLVMVLDPGTGAVLAPATAAATGRRVLGVIPGPDPRSPAGTPRTRLPAPAADPLALARPGGPGVLLDPAFPHAGQAALAITTVPGDDAVQAYAACERALRAGGVLAVLPAAPPEPAADGAAVIAAARAAGLAYAQHVIALRVPVAGSRLAPAPGTLPPLAAGAACARVHADIYLFAKPGGTP